MPEQFKTGDVVMLKSGGPKMTITKINSSSEVWCAWFEGSKKSSSYFESNSLKHAE
jgi:uncharacterized protein YodC (DUF2158 family)